MKYPPLKTFIVSLVAIAGPLSAQTTYNGTGRIDQAGSWTNGIPDTAGNPGTIDMADGGGGGLRSGTYFITQNDGSLVNTFGGNGLSSGQWTIKNGSITSGNDLTMLNSQIFNQDGGTVTINDDLVVNTSSTYTLNGGLLNPNDDLEISAAFIMTGGEITSDGAGTPAVGRITLSGGGSFAISGGVVSLNGGIGTLLSNVAAMTFNGGTTTASTLDFGGSGTTLAFGGTATGSLAVGNFGGTTANRNINWLTGSRMSLTLASAAANWAEVEWAAGRLNFNGQGVGDLGDWATVNGTIFNYDNGTQTLSLVSDTPPASNPFAITSFAAVVGEPGVWQLTLSGDATTDYVFRSSTTLDFTPGALVENLTAGVPAAGTIGGTNDSVVTTDSGGEATVRLTLTGNPSDFVRAETAP